MESGALKLYEGIVNAAGKVISGAADAAVAFSSSPKENARSSSTGSLYPATASSSYYSTSAGRPFTYSGGISDANTAAYGTAPLKIVRLPHEKIIEMAGQPAYAIQKMDGFAYILNDADLENAVGTKKVSTLAEIIGSTKSYATQAMAEGIAMHENNDYQTMSALGRNTWSVTDPEHVYSDAHALAELKLNPKSSREKDIYWSRIALLSMGDVFSNAVQYVADKLTGGAIGKDIAYFSKRSLSAA